MMTIGKIVSVCNSGNDTIHIFELIHQSIACVFSRSCITTKVQVVPFACFFGEFINPLNHTQSERPYFFVLRMVFTKQSLAHFSNSNITNGKCIVLQRFMDRFATLISVLNRSVIIHKRSCCSSLSLHDFIPLHKRLLSQLQHRLEFIPESFNVSYITLTSTNSIFNSNHWQIDCSWCVVTTTNSTIPKAMTIIAYHRAATHS